jgi:hypothetical protein
MLRAGTAPRWLEVERGKAVGGEEGAGGGGSGPIVQGSDAGAGGRGRSEARGWGGSGGAARMEIDAENLDQLVSLIEVEIEEGVQHIGALRAGRVCAHVVGSCVPCREGAREVEGAASGMRLCGGRHALCPLPSCKAIR